MSNVSPVKEVTQSYYEIKKKRLSTSSQLNLFNILEGVDKVKFMNIFRFHSINSDILNDSLNYYVHDVGEDEWLDTIANKYYGSTRLWWIIPLFNYEINPFEMLTPGSQLKVLRSEYIYQVLKDIEKIKNL